MSLARVTVDTNLASSGADVTCPVTGPLPAPMVDWRSVYFSHVLGVRPERQFRTGYGPFHRAGPEHG